MGTWQPSLAIKASIALHAGCLGAALVAPGVWPWLLALILADHVVLTLAGLLPRSRLLGPNLTHLPVAASMRREIALTIDDGPDPEVTPHVLDLLDAAGAKATFFCIGRRARQFPELCREIVRRGHQVENHGDSHATLFATFGYTRMKADIAAGQTTLGKITARTPRFFRPTAGLRNPFLDPVLHSLGLRLASWTRRPYDTRCHDPETVYRRLIRDLGPGDILLMHDGNAARTSAGRPVILVVLPRLLAACRHYQLHPVTLDQATRS